MLTHLRSYLSQRIPNAQLQITPLVQVPEISLYLLNEDYPQDSLSAAQAESLMDAPPYWAFCWASGQVLARYLLDHADVLKNKTVVDFGSGSGVVAIAAALAGAKRCIACDTDLDALEISQLNAQLNHVSIEVCSNFNDLTTADKSGALITVADVFYDRDNMPLLEQFNQQFAFVFVADSRLRGRPLNGLSLRHTVTSHTIPNLNESSDFNTVAIYTTS